MVLLLTKVAHSIALRNGYPSNEEFPYDTSGDLKALYMVKEICTWQ